MTQSARPPVIDHVALNQEYTRVHARLDASIFIFKKLIRVADPDPRVEPIKTRLKRIENLFDKLDQKNLQEAEDFIRGGPKTADRFRQFEERTYRHIRFRTAVAKAQLALEPQARAILYEYERVGYSAHSSSSPRPSQTPDREQER